MSNKEDKSSQLPNPEDAPSDPLVTELPDTDGSVSASTSDGGAGGGGTTSGADGGSGDELVEQYKRLAQRAQADLVNYRRRIEAEQQSALVRNQQRVVLRFVDVIDQLAIALKSDTLDEVDTGWFEGINAIHKKFLTALSFEGFERFDSLGEDFDPRKHEALLSSASADSEPNTVIAELRPGYMHNDEVARPAQVEIAVAAPDQSDE